MRFCDVSNLLFPVTLRFGTQKAMDTKPSEYIEKRFETASEAQRIECHSSIFSTAKYSATINKYPAMVNSTKFCWVKPSFWGQYAAQGASRGNAKVGNSTADAMGNTSNSTADIMGNTSNSAVNIASNANNSTLGFMRLLQEAGIRYSNQEDQDAGVNSCINSFNSNSAMQASCLLIFLCVSIRFILSRLAELCHTMHTPIPLPPPVSMHQHGFIFRCCSSWNRRHGNELI